MGACRPGRGRLHLAGRRDRHSPVRAAIAGLNAWKPLRQDHDWITKRYDVWQDAWMGRHPESVARMQKAELDFQNGVSFKENVQFKVQR